MRYSKPRSKKPLEQERYGRLVVVEDVHGGWQCRCDCGNTVTVKGNHLRQGRVQSCGCLHRERQVEVATTHGLNRSLAHITWINMRQRCRNQNHPSWPNYGGRGITICDRWSRFENFYADMGDRPAGMTIERIDNNGNYEPGNCRWASKPEQSVNKRTNVFIERDGQTKTLSQWCNELGINYWTAHARIRRGASPLEAITQ